jgi:hypothetical protein
MPYDLDIRDEYDNDSDDNLLKCRHCGASDPYDLEDADHLSDCPSNPYGYNNPRGLEILIELSEIADDSNRPIDLPIPAYTGSEF